jgi:hypothetical protein
LNPNPKIESKQSQVNEEKGIKNLNRDGCR